MSVHSARWVAFSREAAIAGQSISAGLEALRKATYASTGLYSHAFFSLSIGLERMGKLIYIVDFMNRNNGKIPTEQDLKQKFGHKISDIFRHVEQIHACIPNPQERYPLPLDGIERQIIEFLSDFAERTRYYNLNYLSNPGKNNNSKDPIARWESEIGGLIYAKHYSLKRKSRDAFVAAQMDEILQPIMIVQHTSEQGTPLTSVRDASIQTGKNRILQKYGTFYCAKICRFFYMMIYEIHREAFKKQIEIPFLDEFFFPFLNDDEYLIDRKTFPPRS